MLKNARAVDFEAHQDTFIHFGPGLNVIHGKSNKGKSAFLRAIELAGYGSWAAGENKKEGVHGPVRIGAKLSSVTVESDRGTVNVKRGKNINEWEINNTETGEDFSLQNPGGGAIPQAQDVLGLRSIEIAGSQIRFNWSDQRDKHFLIDEVEGKSSSPSFVAGILDEVGGLSGCEDLVRELAADKGAFEKAMKESAEQAQKIDESLEKFIGLNDQISLSLTTEEALNKTESLQVQINSAKMLSEKIKNIKKDLSSYENLEKEIEETKNIVTVINEAQEKLEKATREYEISSSSILISKKIGKVRDEIEKLELVDVVDTIEKREKSEKLEKEVEETRKLSTRIKKIQSQLEDQPEIFDFRKWSRLISESEFKIDSLISIEKLQKQLSEKYDSVKESSAKLQESQVNKDNAGLEYKQIVDELDICPTCNQEITAECKAEMIEGV